MNYLAHLHLAAPDPEARMNELVAEYTEQFANPYLAAEKGYIDEVILPEQTRSKLIRGYKMLENKVVNMPRKKHGNIPL